MSSSAMQWLGKPFAGFLLLENRVVASAGLALWPATEGGEIYQLRVDRFDDRECENASDLADYVSSLPIGTSIRYEMRGGSRDHVFEIETRRFGWADLGLLFGAYLFCGLGIGGLALSIRYLRGSDATANGTFIPLWIVGMYSLTAMDLYGPYHFFRLHALCESFLFAAMIHLAMAFPEPFDWLVKNPRRIRAIYAVAGVFALLTQLGLYAPEIYIQTHQAAVMAFGAGLAGLIASQVFRWVNTPTFETRQRIKVVVLGCAAALGPQVVIAIWSGATGGKAPQNVMAFTGVLFPISIAYAVMRHNLLNVDELVRRSLHYVIFTIVVTATYAGCLAALDAALAGPERHQSSSFALVLGVVSVFILLPLRDQLQNVVDRSFFRTSFNFARTLERASQRLASVTDLGVIHTELAETVESALHPEWIGLYIRRTSGRPLEQVGPASLEIPELLGLLSDVEDSPYPVENAKGCLAVPFRIEDELRAVLLLGPCRSGRMYSGDDRRLLLALGHQGAVAVQNALAMDELRWVNERLEARVDERTAELNDALHELRHKNDLLTQLSITDSLTGLHNRAYLDEALVTEYSRSRRMGTSLTTLMVDIDYFKSVNDRYGHQVGDEVLRIVAGIIQRNLRTADVAGRYGGEEFLIILTARDSSESGETFAERVRMSVEHEEFKDSKGESFQVTLSVGVATLRPDHLSMDKLVSEADTALYRAKHAGRNRTEIFQAG